MSVERIEHLLEVPISWLRDTEARGAWMARVGPDVCRLRMNDFPEKPLYSLTWSGASLELDDPPAAWKIPHLG